LKEYLIGTPEFKFSENYLNGNKTEILELFTQCLGEPLDATSRSAPILQTVPPVTSAAAPLPSLSRRSQENQSTRPVMHSKTQVDDGFIRIPNTTEVFGARFSYSNRECSRIGHNLLDREGLLPRIKNSKIELVFWLFDLRPKKSYKIEFVVQKQASFDVSLGKNWNQEEEEDASQSLSPWTVRRPPISEFTLSPRAFLTYIPIGAATIHPPIITTNNSAFGKDDCDLIAGVISGVIQNLLSAKSQLPQPSATPPPALPSQYPNILRHEATFKEGRQRKDPFIADRGRPQANLSKLDSADSGGGLDEPALTEDGSDNNSDDNSPPGSSDGDRIQTEDTWAGRNLEEVIFYNPWSGCHSSR
jgi:hypothetical protein